MNPGPETRGGARLLERWAAWCACHPVVVVVFVLVLSALSALHVAQNFRISTDRDAMLSSRLDYRQNHERFERAFPQLLDLLVVVLDGETPEAALLAGRELARALSVRDDLFVTVSVPRAERFLEENSLLFLGTEDLRELADRLELIQPFLGRLTRDPSLAGFADLLSAALAEKRQGLTEIDLDPVLTQVDAAVRAALAGDRFSLSWQELMRPDEPRPDDDRQFVLAQVRPDYGELFPGAPALEAVRSALAALDVEERGVRARLTGAVALADEELRSVLRGSERIAISVMILVTVALVLGLRSWRLVGATLLTLLAGLVMTTAFGLAAVGHLNLISVAFAALYLGLGVDFAIHLALRFRELEGQGLEPRAAVTAASRDVGGSLFLCAATTALAFYAFVPTAYSGVSELGVISGTGMFISLVLTLSLMPALLGRVRLRAASRPARDAVQRPSPTVRWRRPILMAAVAGGAVALVLATRVRFDANPLNLQDPTLEAVTTFRELLETSETPPWSMQVLERDADSARRVALELRALPTVEKAVWLGDFVPDGQSEKLDVLSDLLLTLGPDLGAGSGTAPEGDEASAGTADGALAELAGELDAWTASPAGADDVLARRLAASLGELRATLDARGPEGAAALVGRLEHSLLDTLPVNLERLSAALSTEGLAEEDLPREFVERWVNPAGTYRVEVFAGNDLDEPVALDEFVTEVRGVASDATGAPRMIVESGRAVVRAFVQAFLASLAATVVILLFLLRSFRDAALVLVPLLLAGLLTGATTELCGIPFNFANVIGLPLLLGIGVDSGIHIVHRVRSGGVEGADVLRSSTARGVVFSALTTLVSFVSLALSPHRGTASMGALLTIGIVWTVLCALLVLPALLAGGRPTPDR